MNAVRAVWEFLVDLIIGDDPKIAVAVVVSLVVAGAALAAGAPDGVVTVAGAVVVVAAFTVSLFVDTRR